MPANIASTLVETLLHSLWQSAALFAWALLACRAANVHPLKKRNALLVAVGLQFVLSGFTFYFLQNYRQEDFSISLFARDSNSSLSRALLGAWVLCAAVQASLITVRWYNFKTKLRLSFIKPAAELKIFCALRARSLGIKREVALWLSNAVSTPITYGFLKPVIVMPFAFVNSLSQKDAEALLLHELEHIRSNDFLLNMFVVCAEVIYSFNPFMRLLTKMIKAEREKNCDVRVMDFQYSSADYADVLVKIARGNHSRSAFALAAVTGKRVLLDRIRFFSAERPLTANNRWGSFFLLFAALSIAWISMHVSEPIKNTINKAAPLVTFSIPAAEIPRTVAADAIIPEPAPTEPTLAEPEPEIASFGEETMIVTPAAHDYIPVNYVDESANVKEFTYQEETPQGKVTQTFRLVLADGAWNFEPVLMILEANADTMVVPEPLPQ